MVRWHSKRAGWLSLSPHQLFGRVLVAWIIGSFIVYGTTIGMAEWLYGSPIAPIMSPVYEKLSLSNQLFTHFLPGAPMNLAWLSAYFAVVIQRQRHQETLRRAKLDEALRAAELRLLKSQLNPHFLFNALNGVRALIAEEPVKAQDAVTQLARTLRYT